MTTKRNSALMAGIALLIMAVIAAFTFGYAHSTLVVPGNPEVTVGNLKSHRWLFRTEIIGWHFILLCDILVAWALFVFFRNKNKKLLYLTAALRIVFVFIFGIAILNLIYVLKILNGNITQAQMASKQIMSYLDSFESTWSFGLIIFGFHLLFLGILAFQSKSIHNFWGILLVFTAVSYVVIHSVKIFLPQFDNQIKTVETVLSLPMAFGEIGFAFWLIIRGGKPKTMYKSVNELKLQS
ncbi:DUF4386 family protein [Maribellus comscasis]|uniref:DUF4386 family protein n=1 Tax=Maribellus comscasis TaxID=2681766 RepID=A0A6I6JWJ9_9BACT|nr:DUF4386 domain-containing protein [Maribellus comscasis]QGY45709.1 DUF4386 family protein [Maribellus comscasis]